MLPALEELQARLWADFNGLELAVANLTQGQADWRPAPDAWSVGEVLGHLAISGAFFGRRVSRLVERGRAQGLLAPGPRAYPRHPLIENLDGTQKAQAPPDSVASHGQPLPEVMALVRSAHQRLMDLVPELAGLDVEQLTWTHYLGFPLNAYELLDFAAGHVRRHTFQIERIKGAPGFPAA